ncbi:bifunctional copper resistance protein CopD/cytochrome c oxidase assembly protein [Spirillospora sp. NPDC047279]|uniref:bifunctional copper resistance protein CopD/cytochrome c oxidase assembly protein n=1 Tax=Spirillospora sp. NPDC047279 TaxID=3155478 RepID=UPI0033BFC483
MPTQRNLPYGGLPMVSETERRRASSGPDDLRPLWFGLLAVALVVLAVVIRFGDAFGEAAVPELTQAGAFTKGGLSIAKLAVNLAGAVTVGWLLMTGVFLPGSGGDLSAQGRRGLRAASLCAVVWAVSACALVLFSVSDLFGVTVTGALDIDMMRTFLVELPQGRALLAVTAAAVAVAVAARLTRTPGGTGHLLLLALAGLLPPVFTGHAASTSDHALAVFSLAAHIVGASVWVGGLIVLVAIAAPLRDRLPEIVSRYSALALVSFAVVGASGLINAWIRLGGPHLGSRYGVLVAAKTVALAGLCAFGWWHRRSGIPALRTGRRAGTFLRIAAVEILVMGATMALATGLSRTPTPEVPQGTLDPMTLRLGFPMPGPPGVPRYVLDWRLDPLFVTLVVTGAVLYALGVVRARRGGNGWPVSRTVAWSAGLAIVLAATGSGLARYSMVLFSAHMVQHMVLCLVAPVLLLLGSPVTLALRALPAEPAASGRSPRELIEAAVSGRAARLLSRPLVATALFIVSLYVFYHSPLFEASLRNHAIHSLTMAAFVAIGLLYFRSVIGIRNDRPPPARPFLLLLAVVPFHALFGIGLMASGDVLAADWFTRLTRTWGTAPLHDQRVGGALALGFAGIATLLVMLLAHRRMRGHAELTAAPHFASRD